MSPIVIEPALRDKLLAAKGTIELQDDTGRVFGQFVPTSTGSVWDEMDVPSDEELDRRLRESRRFSTEEVLARLRSLTRSE